MTLIEFECRGHRFAMPLQFVRRVIHSAQPTPLPGAPDLVLGILNVGGEVVTVIDFFRRVGLSFTTLETSQQLLVVDIAGFPIGLIVDGVSGVTTREACNASGVPEQFAGAEFVQAIVRLDDGLCIIVDPEKFLLDDEKALLGQALEKIRHEEQ